MAESRIKDNNKVKSYREKYKRHYNISFGSDMVIHHIDFDRTNNEISNLLLLPRKLHEEYHTILTAIGARKGVADLTFNNYDITEFNSVLFEKLPSVIAECRKWQKLKEYRYSDTAYRVLFKE